MHEDPQITDTLELFLCSRGLWDAGRAGGSHHVESAGHSQEAGRKFINMTAVSTMNCYLDIYIGVMSSLKVRHQ